MRKRRVQDPKGRSSAPSGLKVLSFAGVSLAGSKTDKTSVALLDYYPRPHKVFLSRLFPKIRTEDHLSGDLLIYNIIRQNPTPLRTVAFDVPLSLPKCMRCRLKCPGYESCTEPEILWMWSHYQKRNQIKKPAKWLSPYTERCAELYLSAQFGESAEIQHALGSNLAPLVARAHYLRRRLQVDAVEVRPKISLWRIGHALGVAKSKLKGHRHWESGQGVRRALLEKLVESDVAFIYEQDIRLLVEDINAFDSFMCALTAYLEYRGFCDGKPSGFPRRENWVAVPREEITW